MTSTRARAVQVMRQTAAILLALVAAASCSKGSLPGDLKVADITTARELAADGASIREDARTMNFWTSDTFYAAVQTEGSADGVTIQARWTGPEGTVGEDSKTISPKGATTTLLQAAPPKAKGDRWPAGDYKLEILVNGTSQGTRDLNVR
jgi:hypothetical protein